MRLVVPLGALAPPSNAAGPCVIPPQQTEARDSEYSAYTAAELRAQMQKTAGSGPHDQVVFIVCGDKSDLSLVSLAQAAATDATPFHMPVACDHKGKLFFAGGFFMAVVFCLHEYDDDTKTAVRALPVLFLPGDHALDLRAGVETSLLRLSTAPAHCAPVPVGLSVIDTMDVIVQDILPCMVDEILR